DVAVALGGTCGGDRDKDGAGGGIDRLERLPGLGLGPLPADQHALGGRAPDEIRDRDLLDVDRLGPGLTSQRFREGRHLASYYTVLATTLMHTILYTNARAVAWGSSRPRGQLPRSSCLVFTSRSFCLSCSSELPCGTVSSSWARRSGASVP